MLPSVTRVQISISGPIHTRCGRCLQVINARYVQRRSVRGFPYRLFYWVTPDVVWVLACAHTSREPDYWVDRT